jgi:hypothetical protein
MTTEHEPLSMLVTTPPWRPVSSAVACTRPRRLAWTLSASITSLPPMTGAMMRIPLEPLRTTRPA